MGPLGSDSPADALQARRDGAKTNRAHGNPRSDSPRVNGWRGWTLESISKGSIAAQAAPVSVPVPHVGEDHADTCGEYHNDHHLSRHDRYSFAHERSVTSGILSGQRRPLWNKSITRDTRVSATHCPACPAAAPPATAGRTVPAVRQEGTRRTCLRSARFFRGSTATERLRGPMRKNRIRSCGLPAVLSRQPVEKGLARLPGFLRVGRLQHRHLRGWHAQRARAGAVAFDHCGVR